MKQTQGEAGKVAKVMADNAIGDLDNLTSAWDDVGIQMMETENGPLRGIIQRVTEIIQVTGDWMRGQPRADLDPDPYRGGHRRNGCCWRIAAADCGRSAGATGRHQKWGFPPCWSMAARC